MSSVLRSFAQIPARAKYFIVTDTTGAGDAVPSTPAFSLAPGDYTTVGSMISLADFNTLDTEGDITLDVSAAAITNAVLLKDMGRQITIYNGNLAGSPHLAVYREVQIVAGTDTEGVSGTAGNWNSTYFVKVWAADGLNVNVARTG